MEKIIYLVLLLTSVTGLQAEPFKHQFIKGEKYRIVATVKEKVLRNDALVNTVHFLNKIAIETTGVISGAGNISALFQISAKAVNDKGSYRLKSEGRSSFRIDSQGRYRVGPVFFYPPVRDIPLFPESSLEPGASWTAPAEEVFDLREPYGVRTPVPIPVNVKYTYLGNKTADSRALARFKIEYEYRHELRSKTDKIDQPSPVKISGAHSMVLNWDIAAGKTDSYAEEFYALFNLSNGEWIEFMGSAEAEVIIAEKLDKKETVEDINRDIEKEKIEGARAESAEDGVKITLENVQFPPDSAEITRTEARKIEKIAAILKKYPDRDIRITGHTAAVGTSESCQELSVLRAKAVGDAFLRLGVRRADQMTIEGKGLTRPLASNNTEAGRIKNRRVEITILEN